MPCPYLGELILKTIVRFSNAELNYAGGRVRPLPGDYAFKIIRRNFMFPSLEDALKTLHTNSFEGLFRKSFLNIRHFLEGYSFFAREADANHICP
jgi:hypothetical protein